MKKSIVVLTLLIGGTELAVAGEGLFQKKSVRSSYFAEKSLMREEGTTLFSDEGEDEDAEFNKNNVIAFNYMEFGILVNLHLSYERILSDGYLGLAVNYAMSLDPIDNSRSYHSNLNYYYKDRYSLDINIYPTGQHRVSYFIGPSLIYGSFVYDPEVVGLEKETRNYSSFLVNNGVVFKVVPNMSMGMKAGIGIVRELNQDDYEGIQLSIPLINFNVAFRF